MRRSLRRIMPKAVRRLLGSTVCWAVSGLVFPVGAMAAQVKLPEGLSVEGQSLAGLTVEEAENKVEERIGAMAAQTVTLVVNGESVTTTAGELGFYWGNPKDVEQAVERYESGNLLQRYMMAADLREKPVEISLKTALQEEAIDEFVYEHCAGMAVAAQDAGIVRVNGAFQVTPQVTGIAVDLEGTARALKEAAAAGLEQAVVAEGIVEEIQPRITTADLETIQDVLGTFSTDFSSSGAARSTNLSVGAEKINGRVLMPGETLSGYECLQPFTAANGYRTAAAYENGQVVDSIGGGVCQIATTLYNAALLAELDITQRQNHSMSVSYVKPSQDAAIAGTYKDIKVTNPYETPIYVEGYTKGRTLVFTIYGKEVRPANRQIRFQSETLSVTSPGSPREVLNTSLAPGARRQVQSAHKGIRSRLWKVVTVDGVEQERTLLSTDTYYASPAVIQVGPTARPAPKAPTVPQTIEQVPVVPQTAESAPIIPQTPESVPAKPQASEQRSAVRKEVVPSAESGQAPAAKEESAKVSGGGQEKAESPAPAADPGTGGNKPELKIYP